MRCRTAAHQAVAHHCRPINPASKAEWAATKLEWSQLSDEERDHMFAIADAPNDGVLTMLAQPLEAALTMATSGTSATKQSCHASMPFFRSRSSQLVCAAVASDQHVSTGGGADTHCVPHQWLADTMSNLSAKQLSTAWIRNARTGPGASASEFIQPPKSVT